MKQKKILMDFKTHKVSRNIRMLVPLMNVLLLNSRTGKMGYLASVGEWMEIINNLDEINKCMSLIDGLDIDEGATSYWTSTQYNYEKAWLVTYNGNEFYPNDERKGVSFYAIRVISQLI